MPSLNDGNKSHLAMQVDRCREVCTMRRMRRHLAPVVFVLLSAAGLGAQPDFASTVDRIAADAMKQPIAGLSRFRKITRPSRSSSSSPFSDGGPGALLDVVQVSERPTIFRNRQTSLELIFVRHDCGAPLRSVARLETFACL